MRKSTLNAKRFLAFASILAVGITAFLWHLGCRQGEYTRDEQATARVVRRTFSSTVLATGSVKPQVGAEVKVGSRVSGKVERLHANIGDLVKKGQVIAELEKADLEAAVGCARAQVHVVKARISEADATVKLAQLKYQRQKKLIADDFTSQQAVDDAERGHAVARAQAELVRKQLDAAQSALKEKEVTLSYATIAAPISGAIGGVRTQEGETVAAGLNAPTFVTIIDLDRLQVDAFVDEVDIGRIKTGQRAVFAVDAFPSRRFEGKVSAIYPKAVIQDNVVYYDVVIHITSPYRDLLRPEMTANVTILLETRDEVLAVPAKAVKRVEGRNVAYVLHHGAPQRTEIKVGWRDGKWVEIVEGLKDGQTVVLKTPGESHEEP